MKILEHHIISDEVQQMSCPKNYKLIKRLEHIVIHYTASTKLASTINYLIKPNIKASAHIIIGRGGQIFQLVPLNIQAWHAGRSEYKGLKSLNQFTIGIELMNAGKLIRKKNQFYTYYGERIPANQVVSTKENNKPLTFWHIYTERQITSLIKVCKALKKEYPQLKEIIGHSDITNRKIDPGEAFPWHKIKV
jgi:N-acetylmuramoyl-L-alanine amidase